MSRVGLWEESAAVLAVIEPEFRREQQGPRQFGDRCGAIGSGCEIANDLGLFGWGGRSIEDPDIEFFGDGGLIVQLREPPGEIRGGRLQPVPDQGSVDQEQGLGSGRRK